MRRKFFAATQIGLAITMLACLSACGWHLQGVSRLPASMLKIRIDSVDAYSAFYRELRQSLLSAGAQVDTPDATHPAVIHVQVDQSGQRVLTISARNTPEEYEVYYDVEYSVDLNGKEVIARQRFELTSSYSFDPNAVLAKEKEKDIMQAALARELAGLVLRRLGSVDSTAIADTATHAGERADTAPTKPAPR